MKSKILILFLLLAFTQMVFSQENDFTIPLSEVGKRGTLSVDNKTGPITIKGTNRQDVYVKYTTNDDADRNKVDAKTGMKRIAGGGANLEAEEQNNKVYVQSNNWNKKIILYVEVPRGFDLEVKTMNDGDISIENVVGKIAIESLNGNITAKNMDGSVVANTLNGDIVITFTKITTGMPMNFITFNGNVDVTLPADTKANLKIKSEQGDMYTDFDMQTSRSPAPEKKESGGKKQLFVSGWTNGVINGGGPEFTMQNYNGDIYIRKK